MAQKRLLLIALLAALSIGAAEPRGWLGVYHKELDKATQAALGVTHGVLLTEVVENSPAAKVGLKVGDILLKVDSDEVFSTGDVTRSIGDNPDKTVHIEYLRAGRVDSVDVKLGTRERQLEFDVGASPSLPELMPDAGPMLRPEVAEYIKEIRELRQEIETLQREIERLRKDLKKITKDK